MKRKTIRSLQRIGLVLAALGAARPVAAQEILKLEDIYRLTRERNPRMQAAAAVVNARRAIEPGAGLLPDPQLEIGAMNFSLP